MKIDHGHPRVAVVVPCHKVTRHIVSVVAAMGSNIDAIYCVDDACPDASGDYIEENIDDHRVRVIRHQVNRGVGGAVLSGYAAAIADGASVIVKIDGDGQMDPALVNLFVAPILRGEADYTKGNRFWDLTYISRMPAIRRIGNLGLSFMAKASTGYWNIFDPTNGYTAIHADVARLLLGRKISERYFFETDVLFRLNTVGAVVVDVPMDAQYGDEVSGLSASGVIGEFAAKHVKNFSKRVVYRYFLRDLSVASLELLAAVVLLTFALAYGGGHWWISVRSNVATPVGTIMVATVSLISGLQFLLAFINYDIARVPNRVLHPFLGRSIAVSSNASKDGDASCT